MSIAYDILNNLILDAAFDPITVSKHNYAEKNIVNVDKTINQKNTIFILDRDYENCEPIYNYCHKNRTFG